ncbi:MAG: porphobilinogen synthase, partial [Candidatus Latescibacteria bacterium]|nr:porphobilinogen synthase [Candidatus Latescibacterota bacterium]
MSFPITRMRRMRTNETTRRMVRENHLRVDDLIMPLFVCPGDGVKNEISSMPGNYQMSIDVLVETGKEILDLGIPAVILFGIPDQKDARGTEAYHDHGIIQRAIAALKSQVPDLYVITDVCLCEYTDHGHCGVIVGEDVKNDETVDLLVQESLSHVRAGADMVAPSDMMDGRVGAIREGLDAEGFDQIPIMAYAAKYCSAFYGPFREAAESAPQFGDRRSYQMDPANGDEALREVDLDLDEG